MRVLNFQGLSIRRMISHVILEKQPKDQCSVATLSDELLTFDAEMERLILKRLQDAMGRKGKGFYLEIGNSAPSSFFGQCLDLDRVDRPSFIQRSQHIADLLAGVQTRANIKSGYLMIIEAQDNLHREQPVYIIIKAEPQEALRQNEKALEHIKEVVMSPAQKFYKVGVLYKDDNDGKTYPNDCYSGYVFDEQFSSGNSSLSTYFYRDFLGFDFTNNGPIQTHKFYEKTNEFIAKQVKDDDQREELLDALRVLVKTDTAEFIRPRDFANDYLASDEQKALFNATVAAEFPELVQKDTALLDFSLKTRKLRFDDVQISGPDSHFAEHVRVIKNRDELLNLDTSNENYTILRVLGRPTSVNRT